MRFLHVACFDDWRSEARALLSDEVEPNGVHWSPEDNQPGLFDQIGGGTTTEKSPMQTSVNAKNLRGSAYHLRSLIWLAMSPVIEILHDGNCFTKPCGESCMVSEDCLKSRRTMMFTACNS